jgi:hypothetical protein
MTSRISRLIHALASSVDNEVLMAARALVRELSQNGASVHDLAQAWEEHQARRPAPQQQTKPFDYSKVTTAVTLYCQGKTNVSINKLYRAVEEMVSDLPPDGMELTVTRYMFAQLRELGFSPSRSAKTWSRPEKELLNLKIVVPEWEPELVNLKIVKEK